MAQPVSLAMLRSDIMLDSHPCLTEGPFCCWKQVEINTIASGFGWLGPASAKIHQYVLSEIGRQDLLERIPENKALENLAGAMIEAWKIYDEPKSVVMFVIEDVTFNICDQKFHEFEIRRQNPAVKVIRRTLTEIYDNGVLSNEIIFIYKININIIFNNIK